MSSIPGLRTVLALFNHPKLRNYVDASSKMLQMAGAAKRSREGSALSSRVAAHALSVVDTNESPKPLVTRGMLGNAVYDNPWAPGACLKSTREIFNFVVDSCVADWGSTEIKHTAAQMRKDLPFAEVELDEIYTQKAGDPMRVTWIGHATCLVQMGGVNILTDPMFSDRCSASQWVGPKRYTPPAIRVEDLPVIDVVVLSHSHYDHLDSQSVAALGNRPLWIVPLGLRKWMATKGITNCIEMNWWEEANIRAGEGTTSGQGRDMKVACCPAQHWSSRTFWDRNASLWCGWALIVGSERFYFTGDTGYCSIFSKVADKYGPFDLSAIPIGAYAPRAFMKSQHCDPKEAVQIHLDLKSQRSFGIHWGTFKLAMEAHTAPPLALIQACKELGVPYDKFSTVRHGESIVLGRDRPYSCLFGGSAVAA